MKPAAKRTVHLFAGFAFCECGPKMYVRANSPKYVCEKCRNKMPIVDLEAVYREQLHHFLISPDEIDAHDAAAVEAMREKENLIANAETELRRIESEDESVFQLYLAKELSKEDFGRRHRPLSERRTQIENELPRLQAELDILRIGTLSRREALGEARDLTDRWSDLPLQEKRQIVEAITDRIVIGKEDVEITLLHLPSGSDGQKATQPQGFIAATSCTLAG
jgi:site-specific DNA recombinase